MNINVVGTSGVGKSTLARRLAQILSVPYIEMDRLYWRAEWQGVPDEVFFARVVVATETPGWVLDGNYNRSRPVKWLNVDLVVWVDYGFCPNSAPGHLSGHLPGKQRSGAVAGNRQP